MTLQNSRLFIILLSVGGLLLIPLIAMQFTEEVNWTLSDFAIGGFLLFGFGLLIDFVVRKTKSNSSRVVLIVAVLILFVLIWAELAVGIFGTAFAGS